MKPNLNPLNWLLALLSLTGGASAQMDMSQHSGHSGRTFEAREREVMPFDLAQTRHIFERTTTGGIQRVVVLNRNDARNITLIRQHLKKEAAQFARGDFGDPTYLHGEDMAGLSTLKTAAKNGKLNVRYADLPTGAALTYQTKDARVKSALHAWFAAQAKDHGQQASLK